MGAPATKQKALCVATRCTSAQQFIETFHRFCDEQSFFVATMNMRPVGLETPFSIQLQDKSPVLRGLCVVLDAWPTPANPYKRPGIRLGIRRLTPESEAVFYQLQAMRTATPQEVVNEASEALSETPVPVPIIVTARPSAGAAIPKTPPPIPRPSTPRAGTVTIPPKEPTPSKPIPVIVDAPRPEEQRTPGSELILPANPLSNVSDEALTGFIDCTLYEETANFFRAPEEGAPVDDVAPPPRPTASLPALPPPGALPALPPIDEPALRSIDHALDHAIGHATDHATDHAIDHRIDRGDVVDTSRPIDQAAPRPTPMPAGEAYARPAARRLGKKQVAIGGAAVGGLAILAIVIATRGGATAKPAPEGTPVAVTEKAAPAKAAPAKAKAKAAVVEPAVTDAPKVAKVAKVEDEPPPVAEPSGAPVVGAGPCRVDVTSNPAGTMVQLDGQTIGPSPITIAGPCAKRQVTLVHPRYKPEVRSITPEPGKPAAVDVTLVRPTHSLLVTSSPSGATVSIAGRRAGTTPTRIPLMGFTVLEVKVEKKGYDAVVKKIYSKKPDDRLAVPLPKAGTSGRLNL